MADREKERRGSQAAWHAMYGVRGLSDAAADKSEHILYIMLVLMDKTLSETIVRCQRPSVCGTVCCQSDCNRTLLFA